MASTGQLVAFFMTFIFLSADASSQRSYIIPVYHQAAGQQPYPRSAQSKAMSISLGTGGSKVSYNFTVDTGSGVLLATCRSPTSIANCGGSLPAASNYALTPATTVMDAATCSSTGIGCMLAPSNKCFISEQLTGGGGVYNINNGIWAQDTITFDKATTLITTRSSHHGGKTTATISKKPGALSFKGLFGCAEAYKKCTPDSPADCLNATSECPVGDTPSNLFEGGCPGSNNGLEAGWTFNVGGPASAMAVPEQVFRAGLISNKVTGFCYQRPQKDFNCRARLNPNSAVVLGPALPHAIPTPSRLYRAPLIPAVFPHDVQANQAIAQTHTMRSNVESVSVPVYGSSTPWTDTNFPANVSILWDTGAYGQSTVPEPVYNVFVEYFEAAWAAVNTSKTMREYKFDIQRCADVSEVCGDNINSTDLHSCLQINLPADSSYSVRAAAKRVLASLYPQTIRIRPAGGGVVKLPTAFVLNLCGGQQDLDTRGIAVCSYLQSPTPAPSSYFWLAGPFFMGRFVQFDASTYMSGFPGTTGTIYWSDAISSCDF